MNPYLQRSPSPLQQLEAFLQTLNTFGAWAAVAVFLALLVGVAIWPKWKWWVLGLLIYIASLGFYFQPWFQTKFIAPLNVLRNNGRAISVGLLVVLLIPVLQSHRYWRRRLVLGVIVLFFIFELMYAGRAVVAGLYARGLGGMFIYALIFVVMGWGLSRWLQDWSDVYDLVRSMAVTGAIFCAATICQLAINPKGIIWQHRLAALGSTATLTAELIVLVLLPTSVLIVHPRTGKTAKTFWSALAGLLIVFLIWTGTRNGILMAVVGLALTFRKRLKDFAWLAIVVAFFVVIALSIYQNSTMISDRLFSTLNNRTSEWRLVWRNFVAYPLAGNIGDASVVENSYISTAANMGLIGLVPLGLILILVTNQIVRLQKLRDLLGEQAVIVDLTTGALAAIAAGAIFDGYLLGLLNAPVFCIYIYLAIMAFVFDVIQANAAADAPQEPLELSAMHY